MHAGITVYASPEGKITLTASNWATVTTDHGKAERMIVSLINLDADAALELANQLRQAALKAYEHLQRQSEPNDV